MLDLIALFFLARYIGKLATRKGQQPRRWQLKLVIYWFLFEFTGAFVGLLLFDFNTNMFSIIMVMAIFAVSAFFMVRRQLEHLPDESSMDDDIEQIGNS